MAKTINSDYQVLMIVNLLDNWLDT